MIRVLLADDQAVVRAGLRTILESQADLQVIGEAADGAEALALVAALDPDVVIMDIRMPMLDGIKATRRLTESPAGVRVLVLTTYGLDEYVYEALRADAAGFLLKTDQPNRIIDAVRIVDAGDALLGQHTTRRLIERFLASPPPHAPRPAALDTLTDRELEVLRQVARGLTNREIATRLYIGEGTVKTHVARILAKLSLRDRVQVVVYAYEYGITHPGDTDPPPRRNRRGTPKKAS
jgi:DNA-binding NarL/FixJ family response regulator